ncbi:MAG TPA: hypothetical protein VEY91_03750 [Candidatus Limnocylindria bacterium]|nr:hypothetical protein [Candidatus Limnocylindria bacterium]
MNPLEQIVLAWQSLAYAFRQLFRPRLWAPWWLLGVVQIGVVMSLWWFAHPALSWLMAPLLYRLGGEDALHYPNVFRMIPSLYSTAELVISALLGSLAAGVATALFASQLSRISASRPGGGFGRALRRALPVIVVNLPLNLLVIALALGLETLVQSRASSVIVQRLAHVIALGGALLLQAFFIYGTALVVLGGRSVREALAELPRAAVNGYWAALFLGLIAILPSLPLQELARHTNVIVDRGSPELVGWLAVTQIALALLTSFLLTGSVTVVYQGAVAPRLASDE